MQDKNNFDDNSYEPINSEGDNETSVESNAVNNDDSSTDSMPADNNSMPADSDTMPVEELVESGFDESEDSSPKRTTHEELLNPKHNSESDKPTSADSPSVAESETGSSDNDGEVDQTESEPAPSTEPKEDALMDSKDVNENPDGNCNNVNSDSVSPDNNDNDSSMPNLVIYRIDITEKVIRDWYKNN